METLDLNRLIPLNASSCRLCLATEANSTKASRQLLNLVQKLTCLVITDLDFSSTICLNCISVLTNFEDFRRRCLYISEFLSSHGYCQSPPLEDRRQDNDEVQQPQNKATETEDSESDLFSASDVEEPEPTTKLKKRDLMETKAYRGLCHLCGREFQHLWVHLQSHSEPTETCDICGKVFKSKPNLQLHVLLHKDAELPCDICGKKYRTKMRLKRHQRVHNGSRPFECGICSKRFYTKYNLDVHSRSHTGSRPYTCSVCEESFIHSYGLKNHTDKYHKS